MASRAEAAGDMNLIRGKLVSKYDPEAEAEVISWFKNLLNEELVPGMREVEKQLRNGQLLLKLAQHIQSHTVKIPEKARKMTLRVNTQAAPFKQMENITNFVKFCAAYGVPKNAQFQSIDLYEGRNMAQVIHCIQMLGSECQRHEFQGPTIGPKPQSKNYRHFGADVLKAGEGLVGLQAGTNKFATQKGMSMGSQRHCADIRADNMEKAGQSVVILQAGSNKGASQTGMSIGGVRHGSDIRADDINKDSHSLLTMQCGFAKGANQSGMSMGSVRHVSDIRADDICKDSHSLLVAQSGYNKGASQAGMTIGGVRHAADIRADDMTRDAHSVIGLQAGFNKGASQAGMVMGGVRHVSDIRAEDMSRESQGLLCPQTGYNKGASQTGMSMGALRLLADTRIEKMDQTAQGVTNLQTGASALEGASQTGMSFGGRRDIKSVTRNFVDINQEEEAELN